MIEITKRPCDEGMVGNAPAASPSAEGEAPWIITATTAAAQLHVPGVFMSRNVMNGCGCSSR